MSAFRFQCQRCFKPLKLSQPSGMLSQPSGMLSQPSGMLSSGGREAQEDSAPSPDSADSGTSSGTLPGGGGSSTELSTFTLLGKVASVRTLSNIQKATADISDILSGQKEVDHPLCEECTDTLLQKLDAQLSAVQLDSQKYRRLLEARLLMDKEEKEAQQAELQALELEERRLVQELEALDEERARTAADLRAAQAENSQLQRQEQRLRADYCALKWQQLELLDELSSVKNQLGHAQTQLARLQQSSAFHLAFQIWEEGPLGVINNQRLGRVPEVPVGWAEINAAWGQAALLLLALSNAVRLRFQRFQPVARGSRSYLRSLSGDGAELPLFADGRQSVYLDNKFDQAMLAFLDCLQQFEKRAAEGKGGLCLPYAIHLQQGLLEDTQGGRQLCSIRTHLNTEAEWTRALRFLLQDLKCCLSWASG